MGNDFKADEAIERKVAEELRRAAGTTEGVNPSMIQNIDVLELHAVLSHAEEVLASAEADLEIVEMTELLAHDDDEPEVDVDDPNGAYARAAAHMGTDESEPNIHVMCIIAALSEVLEKYAAVKAAYEAGRLSNDEFVELKAQVGAVTEQAIGLGVPLETFANTLAEGAEQTSEADAKPAAEELHA